MRNIHIALLSAMPCEIGKTLDYLNHIKEYKFGDLTIYQGEYNLKSADKCNVFLTIAWSGWGKVSSARTCTRIISQASLKMPIDLILFTGVAGAINSHLKQWDIIVPDKVIQHDLDASPIFEKYVIPGINKDKLSSPRNWLSWAISSLREAKNKGELPQFGEISSGLVATGDKFISSREEIKNISEDIKYLEAVEMEGAAVAQVAFQERIPWLIIRVISDGANETAAENFNDFLLSFINFEILL